MASRKLLVFRVRHKLLGLFILVSIFFLLLSKITPVRNLDIVSILILISVALYLFFN